MYSRLNIGLLWFLLVYSVQGQQAYEGKGLGTWNTLNVRMPLDSQGRWGTFAEGQLRSLSFYNQYHYYEFKGGLSYRLDKQFTLLGGVGSYNTYREGGNFKRPMNQKEVRTWLQLNMSLNLGKLFFDHRYRAEQRFTNRGYRNRFRYRIGIVKPLNKKRIEPGAWYIGFWNEIFFTDKAPYFERNRVSGAVGYEFSKYFGLQIGYLHQFDYQIFDEIGRDFLQVSLLFNLPRVNVGSREQGSAVEQLD